MLTMVGIAPHPPIIIPEVGGARLDEASCTIEGVKELCRRISKTRPKRLVIITPHGPAKSKFIAVPEETMIEGDFADFGAPQVRIKLEQDQALLCRLLEEAKQESIDLSREKNVILDHGAGVPLYYLQKEGVEIPGLHLTPGFLSYQDLYNFGRALRRAVEDHGLPTALIASGDFSHRLTPGAPAGFSPRGAEFDKLLLELLREGRVQDILNMDEDLVKEAGECGLRSLIIALGTFDRLPVKTDIISYEGPFGVGYLVAALETAAGEDTGDENNLSPVSLARDALRYYLEHHRQMKAPGKLPPELQRRSGAFVSLKKDGALRGCIGTVEPVRDNLAEEIVSNAVSAAVRDPRFPPITLDEVDRVSVSVDILSPLERINSIDELDPVVYGVLVRSGHRSGLLLPDLEGIDTAGEQVDIARRKGGIAPGEPVELYRFTVTRYE